MGCTINAPVHGKTFVDSLNDTEKRYLKEQMELLGKLTRNDKSNIVILPSVSNYVSINLS